MDYARSIAAALAGLALFAAGAAAGESAPAQTDRPILAQNNEPGCPPGGYGVASCPSYGEKSEHEAAKEQFKEPPPNYESQDECLKAGWGVAECKGFDKWWKKETNVEAEPNPKQHQGCGGYGVTQCPDGGGGGARRY